MFLLTVAPSQIPHYSVTLLTSLTLMLIVLILHYLCYILDR